MFDNTISWDTSTDVQSITYDGSNADKIRTELMDIVIVHQRNHSPQTLDLTIINSDYTSDENDLFVYIGQSIVINHIRKQILIIDYVSDNC